MGMMISGPDGHEILTALEGQPLLNRDSDMSSVLSLLSLACRDYLRGILEDTLAISVSRKLSHKAALQRGLKNQANSRRASEADVRSLANGSADLAVSQLSRKRKSAIVLFRISHIYYLQVRSLRQMETLLRRLPA